jgi:hypothetical protein
MVHDGETTLWDFYFSDELCDFYFSDELWDFYFNDELWDFYFSDELHWLPVTLSTLLS